MKSAPSRLVDARTPRIRPMDWLRMSALKFAPTNFAFFTLAPVRSLAISAPDRSAPSSVAFSNCAWNRLAFLRLASVRLASSIQAWSRTAPARFAPARLVLLSRAERSTAFLKSRPDRSRPDSFRLVKSAGLSRLADASTAMTSSRVISACVMSRRRQVHMLESRALRTRQGQETWFSDPTGQGQNRTPA